jgi:hypothetical protein
MMKIAFASLASLAMATAADAAAILQFTQQNTNLAPFVFTQSGTTTTITSTGAGVTNGTWIPVNVVIGNTGTPVTQPAFMAITQPITATGGATTTGGTVNQGDYTGRIEFNFAPSSTPASNILTVNFTGGLLSGNAGGNSATLSASQPPDTVTYTSVLFPTLVAGLNQNNFGIGFSGLTSPLTVTGGTVGSNAGSGSGTFSGAVIPEPASVVMMSISVVAGLGFYGLRRRSVASSV